MPNGLYFIDFHKYAIVIFLSEADCCCNLLLLLSSFMVRERVLGPFLRFNEMQGVLPDEKRRNMPLDEMQSDFN